MHRRAFYAYASVYVIAMKRKQCSLVPPPFKNL